MASVAEKGEGKQWPRGSGNALLRALGRGHNALALARHSRGESIVKAMQPRSASGNEYRVTGFRFGSAALLNRFSG